jgi:hypothetical protein
MKKLLLCVCFIGLGTIVLPIKVQAQDPISLIIKQAIVKVIKAVDLKIQRLQTKTTWLQNAQKVVENTMSKLKLDEITDWVQKQKDLYEQYFNELWKVKDAIAMYHRIKEITEQQIALVKEYKRGYNGVKQDGHFSPEEVLFIGQVYTGIMEESIKNLEGISLVINSFTTQMSDARRKEIIDKTAEAIEKNYNDLKTFNNQNMMLSLNRSKDARDVAVVKSLYGIQ